MLQASRRWAAALCAGGLSLTLVWMDPALAESERARTTADHSKFKELQQDFLSGPEVTRACLSCHTEAAKQVMHTLHWKWETINPKNQQRLGKRHVVNNFCTSVGSNLHACATCHVGYAAMTDKGLIEEPERVDCLVCHATVSYSKPTGLGGNVVAKDVELPPGSGNVIRGQNLRKIAQSVGKTSRRSCGTCHFMGGGGDGVKHGDLDSSLEDPDRKLDVHMDVEGLNFTCATCHQTDGHRVPGSRYTPTAADKDGPMIRGKGSERNPATCQSCHGQTPHKGRNAGKLNDHTVKLACQTCHVPAYARGGIATKLSWDWSTAGRRDAKGKQFVVKDKDGNKIYESRKGSFTFGENVKPQYMWLNGEVIYTLPGDKVDKSAEPIYINRYLGSPDDGRSRIWPVKVFHGNQPYDPVNKTLVVTHLAGADDTAYWTNLDWHKAIETGMRTAGLPFSGQVDFIRTLSVWPITHMVAPKEDALACAECHSRDGRLAKVEGVYIPGRDHIPLLDQTAKWLAILALAGVLVHAGIRVYAHIARKRSH